MTKSTKFFCLTLLLVIFLASGIGSMLIFAGMAMTSVTVGEVILLLLLAIVCYFSLRMFGIILSREIVAAIKSPKKDDQGPHYTTWP